MAITPQTKNTPLSFEKHSLLLSIIEALSTNTGESDSIKAVIKAVKQHTGVDAVGIRLRDGNDFPYYTTEGFSEDFVKHEKFLCEKSSAESTQISETVEPALECLCGIVLGCLTDSSLPYYTENGSFWTNHASAILIDENISLKDVKLRKRCCREGYESIALIPLNADNTLLGMLQLNDSKKGCFTRDMIEFFESLGDSIGLALNQKKIQSTISEINRNLEIIVEERTLELLKILRSREALLHEVHHRIKNNLVTISSLLNLQAMKQTDPGIIKELKSAVVRINSMGIIHHKLYVTDDFSRINVKNHVEELISEIFKILEIEKSRISLNVDCDEMTMNIDTAIPFGLIMNELVTNSIKHVMADKSHCRLSIVIRQIDQQYFISYSDNGTGLKTDFEAVKDSGLGLEIIKTLVKQLDGEITLHNDNGLSYNIIISNETKEELRWKKKF